MDSDNSDNNDQEFWALVEEEFMDNSDEEQQLQNSGSSSRRKRRTTIDRGREERHNRLFNDYFSENPVYTDVQFRRRFRMHRHVFLRIVDALGNYDEYFQMRVDATSKMSLSPLQKCTVVIRMLDLVDEYVRIGESTSIECLQRFIKGVNVVFGAEYLRKPNNTDVKHLLQMGESHGFPGIDPQTFSKYCHMADVAKDSTIYEESCQSTISVVAKISDGSVFRAPSIFSRSRNPISTRYPLCCLALISIHRRHSDGRSMLDGVVLQISSIVDN
ncbi:hypothetical protein KIW84_065089 [Lathyrus oleraceus]|uniref:Uncharacterized protein n=1 Tax=Pisum sativum TaxID=3888 RepID=A0A9D4WEG0_PEA|nr:hypothetical protein KIW84_065089 [Pisum sativum]